MTLAEIKLANPTFFSKKASVFFGDDRVWIEREKGVHVLKVQSGYGTCPVYAVDAETKQLKYLRHDCDPANGPPKAR